MRRWLALLLLLFVASASLINLVEGAIAHATSNALSPCVLAESVEEDEAEESAEFLLFAPAESSELALEVNYAAHIAEEREECLARQLKAHFRRGPPATDVTSVRC